MSMLGRPVRVMMLSVYLAAIGGAAARLLAGHRLALIGATLGCHAPNGVALSVIRLS